jgi:hypothetical protein
MKGKGAVALLVLVIAGNLLDRDGSVYYRRAARLAGKTPPKGAMSPAAIHRNIQ